MSQVTDVPQPSECILSFHELTTVSSTGRVLLNGVTGYVRRGGVTAVLGQGGSGKSLLLRLLCGREHVLSSSGSVNCNRRRASLGYGFTTELGFVGQEDVGLVGELTPREVITFSARLGSATPNTEAKLQHLVNGVIQGLNLDSVADNAIGTVLRRGLSGGEKRRVSVGAVLASRPAVICLDEPTSGLDAAVAYSMIRSIKALAQSNGIGVLLTIHQPSARILTLFDDLIVLDAGEAAFVGPISLSTSHFNCLGFPCPPASTATDHFLDVIRHGCGAPAIFIQGYRASPLRDAIHQRFRATASTDDAQQLPAPRTTASLVRQILVLCHRNILIALRDVSLYWVQLLLASGFAFLTGAVFWSVPRVVGSRLQDQSNAIVWLTFIASYLQVFKIYYLFSVRNRVHDESANRLHTTLAWSISNFVTTAFFVFVVYVLALLIGYGMIGLPNDAIGYVIGSLFFTAMTAEALLELLLQFTAHLPTAILLGQGALVILCVFAGGAFIRWSDLGFWVWLSDLSLYTYSTRGIMIAVYQNMDYTCPSNLMTNNVCSYSGLTYLCESAVKSDVAGSTVLQLYQQVSETDQWFQLGMLVVLFAGFRVLTHLLLTFPPSRVANRLRVWTMDFGIMSRLSSSPVPAPSVNPVTNVVVHIPAAHPRTPATSPASLPRPSTAGEYVLTFRCPQRRAAWRRGCEAEVE